MNGMTGVLFFATMGTVLVACRESTPPSQGTSREASLVATSHPRVVGVEVTLAHGTDDEVRTREQLLRILGTHDVARWMLTRQVIIDRESIPHSHPVLTLHTRHLNDDLLLLSTFIHEQAHWHAEAHEAELATAVSQLRALIPGLPVGYPDGAVTDVSSYEHLVIIALEENGLRQLIGELATRQVMAFWSTDHYRALYQYVLSNGPRVREIMRTNGLTFPPTGS